MFFCEFFIIFHSFFLMQMLMWYLTVRELSSQSSILKTVPGSHGENCTDTFVSCLSTEYNVTSAELALKNVNIYFF